MPDDNNLPRYQVYALRYATREGRRQDNFIGGDPHDGPMPMDYFCWLAISDERRFVIDCGFTEEVSAQRKRTFLRNPVDALGLLGVRAADVEDVIITHLHYDHVGNFDRFPKARFHLQETELAFATGKYMAHPFLSHAFEVEDVVGMVRLNYRGPRRLSQRRHGARAGISPASGGRPFGGLAICQRAYSARLAGAGVGRDALLRTHGKRAPFTTTFHVGDTLEGYDRLRAVASNPDHIVPGHDPLVMQLYPPASQELKGVAARLDEPPQKRPSSA